jgi:hypothetical protein
MQINISDSLVIAILIAIFLLFGLVNSIWVSSISKKIDDVEKLSTSLDDSIFDRLDRLENKIVRCNC